MITITTRSSYRNRFIKCAHSYCSDNVSSQEILDGIYVSNESIHFRSKDTHSTWKSSVRFGSLGRNSLGSSSTGIGGFHYFKLRQITCRLTTFGEIIFKYRVLSNLCALCRAFGAIRTGSKKLSGLSWSISRWPSSIMCLFVPSYA